MTSLDPGDTVTVAFGWVPVPAGKIRDLFLLSRGVYTSNLPARWPPAQQAPTRFALHQNRPNPFTATTSIRFDLPIASRVRLEVFDAQGRRVRTLADGFFPAGYQSVGWDRRNVDGDSVRPGVYLYRLWAGDFRAQKKMVLLP